jgi:hypothetical protein
MGVETPPAEFLRPIPYTDDAVIPFDREDILKISNIFLSVLLIFPVICAAETGTLKPVASPYYSSHPITVIDPKKPVEVQEAQTPLVPGDGSRISLSNEEQKFYQKNAPVTGTGNHFLMILDKGWSPMAQTHSFWGLVLLGGAWAALLVFIVRKIAKSPPRKPPVE